MIITPGATSITLTVQIVDDSGLAVTGLVAATFPSTYYQRAGESLPAAITLSDLAAQNSAYSSGGVKELTGGYYRLDVPDAAFATASRVRIIGEASGKHILYPPITVMHLPANVTQFGGSNGTFASGRPEVNATHLAGTAYGSADLSATMKTSVTTAATAATPTAAAVTGNVGGNVVGSVGSLATQAKADVNAECDTALADYDAPTNAEMEARTLVAASYATAASQTSIITHLTDIKGATFSGATDSLEAIRDHGDAAWITATSVTVSDKTGFKLASDGLALVTAWTVDITGSLSGSVGSVSGAVGSVTGNVGGNVTGTVGGIVGTITTLDALGTAITSYGDLNWETATGFAVAGDQMNLVDAAITESKISTPAEASGRPTGILTMIRRIFEKMAGGNKQTRDRSTGTVTLRNAADDGNLETHTQSTSGDVDTQTKGA